MVGELRATSGFDPAQIAVLVFDVGGTVFDWHGSIRDAVERTAHAQGVSLDAARFTNVWRRAALAMVGRVRAGELPWMTVDEVHDRTLNDLLPGTPLRDLPADAREALVRVWHRMRAWPDAPPAIERLRSRYTVVVLSILNFSLLIDCSKAAGIAWDGLILCEFIGRYKDDPLAYQTALRWICGAPSRMGAAGARTITP